MTTYPLETLAAQIDSSGISAPSYQDIYASLQASFKNIYGTDSYLDPDSQDGQMLAVFARAISDSNNTAISVYNSFSPATAQGTGLSRMVKVNGLTRLVPSSTAVNITIVGVAGTVITNGIVSDGTNQFLLPDTVTIDTTGSVVVTAYAANPGAITAAAGTVTTIVTPTLGWQNVSNSADAIPGAPVESDATLRVRQSVSTSLAAQTIIDALYGALANLSGVQQLKIFENDTSLPDSNSLPQHSIAVVIKGGDATTIAQTIANKKSPGCDTYGSTYVQVIDSRGIPANISFFVPVSVTILVDLSIKALPGYTSTIGAEIVQNIVNYINAEGINANGGLLSLTSLYSPIYGTDAPQTYNVTNLQIARSPASPAAADLAIAFNEYPTISASNITLIVS